MFEIPFLATSYKSERPIGLNFFKRIVTLNTFVINPMEKIRFPFTLEAKSLNHSLPYNKNHTPKKHKQQLCYQKLYHPSSASYKKYSNELVDGIFHNSFLLQRKTLSRTSIRSNDHKNLKYLQH